MSKRSAEIAKLIKDIAGVSIMQVCSGAVVAGSVNEEDFSCSVILGDDSPVGGVLLSIDGSANGIIVYPEDNSQVLLAELDGGGRWAIIATSQIRKAVIIIGSTKIEVMDGQITFNGGDLGGLTKTLELKAQLEKNNALLMAIVNILNGPPVTEPGNGAPSALQAALQAAIAGKEPADYSDIENPKIKQ